MADTDHDHAALMPSPVSRNNAAARAALVVLLAVRLILAIAFSLATPPGEAPDEADHYAYAAYILETGELPVGPEMTQGKHPPLYHILAAAAGRLVGGSPDRSFLRANPDMAFGPQSQATNFFIHTTVEDWPWREGVLTMRAGRFVSILAGLVLVLATFLLGRAIWPARPELALAGAAFAALLPESLFAGGAMSNDMLAAMWSTLAMWLALRGLRFQFQQDRPAINRRATQQRPINGANAALTASLSPLKRAPLRSLPVDGQAVAGGELANVHHDGANAVSNAVLAGVCLGLAFVTKASTGSLALVVAAALLAEAWPKGTRSWPGLRTLAPGALRVVLAGAAAFVIAAPWLWRNLRLYGDPFGWPLVLATVDRRQGPLGLADVAQLLAGWWLSFWGKFGGAGHIALPAALYVVWAVTCVAAIAGWVVWWARKAPRAVPGACTPENLVQATPVSGWIVLLGAPLVTAAGIYSYSQVALGTDQGRLLFPALAPIALLIAGGLSAWLPRRATRLDTGSQAIPWSGVFAGGMALVAIAALITGLVRPFAPPTEPQAERIAAAEAMAVAFGPLELVATAWDDPAPGQLTLYWRAIQATPDDLRTALRLLDANGSLLWEWKRSPGAGRFSTDKWPVGRVVADTYLPPQAVLAQTVRAEVGVRPFPEGPWVPASSGAADPLLPIPR